jgi:class 3 adenylate cyclase
MDVKTTALVIADISGYTRFIVSNRVSQLHAELIVTDLIEAVAAEVRHPLRLNKLEGDAAFFVAPLEDADAEALDDVIDQVRNFFGAFRDKQAEHFAGCHGGCRCSACRGIQDLKLKAFVHVGEVIYKTIGSFQEVAGEDVILVHRLLKNTVPNDEYVLMTKSAADLIQSPPFAVAATHTERVDDLGPVEVVVYQPDGAAALVRPQNEPFLTVGGVKDFVLATWYAMANRVTRRRRTFNNLPV